MLEKDIERKRKKLEGLVKHPTSDLYPPGRSIRRRIISDEEVDLFGLEYIRRTEKDRVMFGLGIERYLTREFKGRYQGDQGIYYEIIGWFKVNPKS